MMDEAMQIWTQARREEDDYVDAIRAMSASELKQEIESARELARTGDYNEHPCEIGYAETIVDLAEALAARDALIAEVREQVALLYVASGCDCCRDDKGWYAASARLADLLKAPRYDDDSEQVDWYAVRDEYAALKETKHD